MGDTPGQVRTVFAPHSLFSCRWRVEESWAGVQLFVLSAGASYAEMLRLGLIFASFAFCLFATVREVGAASAHIHSHEREADGALLPEEHNRIHKEHQSHSEFDHEAILGKSYVWKVKKCQNPHGIIGILFIMFLNK